MVTAWSATTRMALVNVLAPGNNEAAWALHLVELLQLKGCVVTADALHCHCWMAKAIVERGGQLTRLVSNNQPGLLRDAKAAISAQSARRPKKPPPGTPVTAARKPEPRSWRRSGIWPKSTTFRVSRPSRGSPANVQTTKPSRRHSLPTQYYTPAELLRVVREHWGIENVLH